MSYDIKKEKKGDYLKFCAYGKQTFDNNKELVFYILNECVKEKVDTVLVDIRGFEGSAAVHEDHELAGYTAREGGKIVHKAAMLHSPEKTAETGFFVDGIRNKGINALPFTNEEEAVEWLKGK